MTQQLDMKTKEARAAILREWFALAPDQRANESQAAQFAEMATGAHGLPANGDGIATIKVLLARYTGLNPIF